MKMFYRLYTVLALCTASFCQFEQAQASGGDGSGNVKGCPSSETGPHNGAWGSWYSESDGTLSGVGVSGTTDFTIEVGGSITAPTISGTCSSGSKNRDRTISYDCSASTTESAGTTSVSYTEETRWDPEIPSTFDEDGGYPAGTYTFTAKIKGISSDSVCADASEQDAGTITVTVGCEKITGSKQFGPFNVSLSGVTNTGSDANGCSYSADGGLTLSMSGAFSKSPKLSGVSVTWTQDKNGAITEAGLKWSGSVAEKFGVIDTNLTAFDVSIDSSGGASGSATFGASLTSDVSVGGVAKLKSGLGGNITYKYASGGDEWDFSGLTGFKIAIQKGSKDIIEMTASNIGKDGKIIDASLTAKNIEYTTNGYTAKVTSLNWKMDYDIAKGASGVTFKSGSGEMKIKATTKNKLKSEITLTAAITATDATLTVKGNKLDAFGCEIKGTIKTTMKLDDFDISEIAGSNLSLKHTQMDQEITKVNFKIKDDTLEEISAKAVKLKYKVMEFNVADASYNKEESLVKFDAKYEVGDIKMAVDDFKMKESEISVAKIKLDVSKSPVVCKLDLAFETSEFKGKGSAKIGNKFGVDADIVFGAQSSFNYGYLGLSVKTAIPIAQTGLQVTRFAGKAGYNYNVPAGGGAGTAESGKYYLGVGSGFGDVAGLVNVTGDIGVSLGGDSTRFDVDGSVQVPSSSPIFNGNLKAHHTLGTTKIDGKLTAGVKLPASSGNIFKINSSSADFEITGTSYSFKTTSTVEGSLFSKVDFETGFDLSGAYSSSSTGFSGSASGNMDYDYQERWTYPDGFDPSNYDSADDTDSILGFGCKGELNIELAGAFNTSLDSSGVTGTITTAVSGTSNMKVKWPDWSFWDDGVIQSINVSASGNVTLTKVSSGVNVKGTVTFTDNDETSSADLDVTI